MRSRRSCRSCASIDNVAIGRASSRLIEIGSPVSLLGVPDDERGPLRDWSLTILGALEPVLTPEQFQRGSQAVDEFDGAVLGGAVQRIPTVAAAWH